VCAEGSPASVFDDGVVFFTVEAARTRHRFQHIDPQKLPQDIDGHHREFYHLLSLLAVRELRTAWHETFKADQQKAAFLHVL